VAVDVLVDAPGLPYDDVPPDDEVVPAQVLLAAVLPSDVLSTEPAPIVELAADAGEFAVAVVPAFMSVLPSPAPMGDGWVTESALACPYAGSAAASDPVARLRCPPSAEGCDPIGLGRLASAALGWESAALGWESAALGWESAGLG
jgi:hypothetical protein